MAPLPVEEIADAYAKGATMLELAARYGVSRNPIRRAIHASGVASRSGGYPRAIADSEAALMAKDHRAGMTVTEIAARYGVGRGAVRSALTREGIPRQRPGRPDPFRGREHLLAADYRAGATIRGLMAKYGGSDRSIRGAIVSQGVAIRPTGSRPGTPPWNTG